MKPISKLTKNEREDLDRRANQLYDQLNPEPEKMINVSKAECIRRVREKLNK